MDAIVLDTYVSGIQAGSSSLVAVAANFPSNCRTKPLHNLAGLLRESAVLSRASSC